MIEYQFRKVYFQTMESIDSIVKNTDWMLKKGVAAP